MVLKRHAGARRALHRARPSPPAAVQLSQARAINEMDAAAARGDVVTSARHFNQLRHTRLSNSSFLWNLMLKAYACAGDHRGAREHLCQMLSFQVHPTHRTFGKVMKAAARRGLPSESERAWREFLQSLRAANYAPLQDQDFRLKVNMMVDAAANAGDAERAVYWLRQLGDAADCWSYAGVLKAHASQSNAPEAVSCLQQMRSRRLTPDSVCFVAAITACGRSGDVDGALDLLQQMERDSDSCKARIQADLDAASTSVVNAFAKSSNVVGAEEWLEKSRTTPTLQMYHTLLDAAGRSGLPQRAEHFFRCMLAAGHQPSAQSAGALIAAVLGSETSLSGIRRKSKTQLEVLQSLNLGLEKSAPIHLALTDAFSRCSLWTSALSQLSTMAGDGCAPSVQAYTAAITACGRALQISKMKHLFDVIADLRLRRDEVVYGSCIHAAARSRDRSLAEELLAQMLGECLEPNLRTLQSLRKVMSVDEFQHRIARASSKKHHRPFPPTLDPALQVGCLLVRRSQLKKSWARKKGKRWRIVQLGVWVACTTCSGAPFKRHVERRVELKPVRLGTVRRPVRCPNV